MSLLLFQRLACIFCATINPWIHCTHWFCFLLADPLQGSELAGWAEGRYTFEGIDLNHNFPDLNTIMWDDQEVATDKSKALNHYIPIPEYYTKEDAMVRTVVLSSSGHIMINGDWSADVLDLTSFYFGDITNSSIACLQWRSKKFQGHCMCLDILNINLYKSMSLKWDNKGSWSRLSLPARLHQRLVPSSTGCRRFPLC